MTDALTQLQDSLDQLLIRMYATLNYIQSHHPYGEIPGQPSQAPQADDEARKDSTSRVVPVSANGGLQAGTDVLIKSEDATPGPDTADKFHTVLRDLARDLVLQHHKGEYVIKSLPGVGNSEQDQMRRMQELEVELREVEAARAEAEKQKIDMLRQLDGIISQFGRVR